MIFMRLLFDKQELEDVGKPTRSDLLWAAFVFPIFSGLAVVSAYRLIRAALGHDLTLSAIFEKSLSFAGGSLTFAAGIGFYVAVLLIACVGLWWCAVQMQRWHYWRR
jgi:hypothetical protein